MMSTIAVVKKRLILTWLKESMEFAEGSDEQQERRKMSKTPRSLAKKTMG